MDAWAAQSVKHLASAQVMISQVMSSSSPSGFLLSAQSPLGILCPPHPLPLPAHALKNNKKNFLNKNVKKTKKIKVLMPRPQPQRV